MCSNHILHKNAFGCVLRCDNCKRIQLTFGNAVLVLNDRKFHDFVSRISRFCRKEIENYDDPYRNFFIDTHDEAVSFVFNYQELFALESLLCKASIVLEARTILK